MVAIPDPSPLAKRLRGCGLSSILSRSIPALTSQKNKAWSGMVLSEGVMTLGRMAVRIGRQALFFGKRSSRMKPRLGNVTQRNASGLLTGINRASMSVTVAGRFQRKLGVESDGPIP